MKKKLPTPQKLPSGMWRCQVMVAGKRVSVVDEDPGVAQARAVALKAGLIEEKKKAPSINVIKLSPRNPQKRQRAFPAVGRKQPEMFLFLGSYELKL